MRRATTLATLLHILTRAFPPTRSSVRLNDDVHQHGFYCRFCEDRIPGVPSHFCITSLFPHFSDGGCPVLSALPPSDLDTFLNALRAVDPSTGQELEDERVARELKRCVLFSRGG